MPHPQPRPLLSSSASFSFSPKTSLSSWPYLLCATPPYTPRGGNSLYTNVVYIILESEFAVVRPEWVERYLFLGLEAEEFGTEFLDGSVSIRSGAQGTASSSPPLRK